jgi:hypothetical protein
VFDLTYEENVIIIDVKPINDITISSKISSYELNLINKLAEKCGISRSSFIRFSIQYTLYKMFVENQEIDGEWKKIIDQYKLESEKIFEKCKEKS